MDKISKNRRSWNMARIKGKNTSPELMVRKFLSSNGLRYRLITNLKGKPDIVIKKARTVIFINGCFWHWHGGACKESRVPLSNTDFWLNKLHKNRERDRKTRKQLRFEGWKVITIWECQLETKNKRSRALNKLLKTIQNNYISNSLQ